MGSKICGRCNLSKPLANFHKRRNGFQSICKKCRKELDKQRYSGDLRKKLINIEYRNKIRLAIANYKLENGGCKYCPENDPVALDLHHPNDNKEFNVGQWHKAKGGFAAVIKEIRKCQVVCSNCHRKLHAGRTMPHGCDGCTSVFETERRSSTLL